MNRPDLYKKTVDILYDAYFNDTLEHGNYCGCAVGNLIAANKGYRIWRAKNLASQIRWVGFDDSVAGSWYEVIAGCADKKGRQTGKQQLRSTGYNLSEIQIIETSFESCRHSGISEDESMFNGLVAVLEALKQIHEVTDEELISTNQKRFADHHKKLTTTP